MSLVLLAGGCVILVAFVVLLLLPHIELRTTSAGAERAQEDRAREEPVTEAAGSGSSCPVSAA